MPNPAGAKYPAAYMGMGETAENLAKKYGLARAEQEQFALLSRKRERSGELSDKLISRLACRWLYPLETTLGTRWLSWHSMKKER